MELLYNNFMPMLLEEKIIQVESFYTDLDKDLATFQSQSNLSCLSGCSACCHSPEIEATVLELLPLALHLYKENQAEEFYKSLLTNESSSLCLLYKPILANLRKGACTEYQYRPMVCRLFGFSFIRDKESKPIMLTCKTIKSNQQKEYQEISNQAEQGLAVPFAGDYFMKLTNIDFYLTQHQYPINEAMRYALEMLLNHFHYTETLVIDKKQVS
ncbi:MAG TPA: YkgJ family cysteine cluster protein [Cytophagaceae bacterium]|jgi:Fe-S-cluster containining protein|nr:YkgJ family cysteine cluster protein [Cytophagaceae bacterium]